ncbi:MAG: VanZ family protein [Phycisphaerae bacterium]
MRRFSSPFRLTVWLLYWAMIFLLTHTPISSGRLPNVYQADKVVHFGMFFGLGVLGGWYRVSRGRPGRSARLVGLALWLGLYALLDEATQPYVGRTASVADFGADVLGILAACWALSRGTPAAPRSDRK